MMPLIPGSICIAWELNALIISRGLWVHVLWLGLDVFIFILNIYNIAKLRNRILYITMTVFWAVFFAFLFRITAFDLMFISSFLLDLGIAVGYVIKAKDISRHGQIPIAITKLLGDMCACIFYSQFSNLIVVIGIIVFLLNLYYLAKCLDLAARVFENKCKKRG